MKKVVVCFAALVISLCYAGILVHIMDIMLPILR